ncbi:hypothetical protein IV454_30875 [Massilia antarctica]|uniref:Type II secretion system protein GspG C-terminal domain-containing protein n=1 Tax=Massilia antarctica TaxID=2765360 RepID=A0AA49A8E8_9BURK|nr:hypothetical protein [Massilia antarctica]QPI49772.1 hypothetical protein IV454_30875 [Massilia antarctica]
MNLTFTPPPPQRHTAALALTVLVHGLLIVGWQYARRLPPVDHDPDQRIQWVTITPQAKPKVPAPPPPPRPEVRKTAGASSAALRPARAAPAPAQPATEQPAEAVTAEAPSTLAPSAADIMQQARRSIGKIDQDLRKAHPGQPITAPVTNGASRLAQGMQAAADAAPNRWYEAPKVTEIIDPGPYSRRRYRVVGANGTYCITVESNHAPDGLDIMKNGIQHKKTTCEKSEQAATEQKW